MSVEEYARFMEKIHKKLCHVIVGKDRQIKILLAGLLSGGHILIEDIPGVGKTTLAKALALSVGGKFSRIQFTPDLLPTDITGTSIYNPKDGEFLYKPGPVFANILLADEINRASPRTQSALLEAMGERQVTVDGRSRDLDAPFLVIATQNPIESHGTYPLPEAQLDRFAIQLKLGYPPNEEEKRILYGDGGAVRLTDIEPVIESDMLIKILDSRDSMGLEDSVADYILALVDGTRDHPSVQLGSSPRGGLALLAASRAWALMQGRDHVSPGDIKVMAVPTLAHRLVLDAKAKYAGIKKESVIEEILNKVPVPR